MLVYGIIKEIHDYEMDVSLPNGLMGYLPITNISSSYTELLHRLTEEDESTVDEVCECRVHIISFSSLFFSFASLFCFIAALRQKTV